MKLIRHFLVIIFLLFTISAYAWSDHIDITYMALKNMPEVSHAPNIPAETLSDFISKEKTGLANVLKENEQWSVQNLPHYAALPTNLAFTGTSNDSATLTKQFLMSMRVNPEVPYALYLIYPTGVVHRIHNPISKTAAILPALSTEPALKIPSLPIEKINPGQHVSSLEILSAAVDEPDYGIDIGVWNSNNTWFGNLYNFGKQPFGNKKMLLSSQAGFHMGFYYESPVLYAAAKYLRKDYPLYRIHLFLTLARYAFSTHHPYWGYRFLGWALHYVQDLTQPYHSTVAPGFSTLRLLTVNTLKIIGFPTPEKNLVQLLTNRHLAFENYEFGLVQQALLNNATYYPFEQALADTTRDSTYPTYSDNYPLVVVAKESHDKANTIGTDIKNAFPSRYVSDPTYLFYVTEPNINILPMVKPSADLDKLNAALIDIFKSVGSHTRNVVRYALQTKN